MTKEDEARLARIRTGVEHRNAGWEKHAFLLRLLDERTAERDALAKAASGYKQLYEVALENLLKAQDETARSDAKLAALTAAGNQLRRTHGEPCTKDDCPCNTNWDAALAAAAAPQDGKEGTCLCSDDYVCPKCIDAKLGPRKPVPSTDTGEGGE